MTDRGTIEIRVTRTTDDVAVIKAFRGATIATISEIKRALTHRAPIATAHLYGLDHDHAEEALRALLHELDRLGTEYEIIVDGTPESCGYLNNILQRWRDIGVETEMITALEIGEPDVETLKWLKREYPSDVFRSTLRQIVHGDGYRVDSETLDWAKRQLGDA